MSNLYRCYFDSADDAIECTGSNTNYAAHFASIAYGCHPDSIIVRYVKSFSDQPYDPRDAELRKALVK